MAARCGRQAFALPAEFRYDGPHARDTTSTMYQLNWRGPWLAAVLLLSLGGDAPALARQLAEPAPACRAPQTMALTVNSDAVATASNDINDNTLVALRANGTAYWTVLLSTANILLQLGADRGDTIVTFQKGLTLRFQALGPQQYQILIDGPILDDGTQYTLTGKVIAVFERCPVPPAPAAQ